MLNMEKAEKILRIAQNEYPSLFNEIISLEVGEQFSVTSFMNIHNIEIQEKLELSAHNGFMYKYLRSNYNLDTNVYIYDSFLEVFALLHEIGHIYYSYKDYDVNEIYQEYKEKTYNNYVDAWTQYRQLPNEKEADLFAVNIMKEKYLEIWSIMENISIKEAKEQFEFWNIEG